MFIKIGTVTINTFLPMRNKLVYSCNIIHASGGFDKPLGRIFCLWLVVEMSSLQKVVKRLEEVVAGWQAVR